MIEEFIEEVQKLIPLQLKKDLQKREFREKLLQNHGTKAFLDPNNLKYPVFDQNGFNCSLCYAAYLRSKQNKQMELSNKAKKLFSKYDCENNLNIHIGENQSLDFITFIDLFEHELDDLTFMEVI